jgi:hypothetical protein
MGRWRAFKQDNGDIEIVGWRPEFGRNDVTRNPFKDKPHLPMDKGDYRAGRLPEPNPLHGIAWFQVLENGRYRYQIDNGDGWVQNCTGHHVVVRPCEAPLPKPAREAKCILLASFDRELQPRENP